MTADPPDAGFQSILYEVRDGIARLTLNRPEKLNAFHLPMYHEIRRALALAADDERVRVVILRGAGRAFCVGRDFKFSADLQKDEDGLTAGAAGTRRSARPPGSTRSC